MSRGPSLSQDDPLLEVHRLVGQNLAESAFLQFGPNAEERQLFGIEVLMHPTVDSFMSRFDATDDQKMHAKLIVGHALRARYCELARSAPAARALMERSQ
jgi:hypothetical protein